MGIMVVSASGIRNSDWLPGTGKPDCYCTVKSAEQGRELFRTKILNDQLAPMWNEEARLIGYKTGESLEFEVWDKDLITSESLGKVTLSPDDFAQEGWNGQLKLTEAGDGIDSAFLNVKIKMPDQDYPKGPSDEFEVTVEKQQGESLGLDLDLQDGTYCLVKTVDDGPLQQYNEQVKPTEQIKPGDFVLSVNGETTPKAMLKKFRGEHKFTMTVRRSTTVYVLVDIQKSDKGTPGLEFPKEPVGEWLCIKGLQNEGWGKSLNDGCEDSSAKFQVGDRIAALAGASNAGEVRDKLAHVSGKTPMRLVRILPKE
mmetsp:Transcript_112515/g.217998  ORF Transcript_112515/g.217998 Transcript_112515/m.217998 type:complete len:312 (+) Transcript_112515:57-992(+)